MIPSHYRRISTTPEHRQLDVVCIGTVCVDMFVPSHVVWPASGQRGVSIGNVVHHPGGNALLSAVGLSELGARVGLIGAVGSGRLGGWIRTILRDNHVTFSQPEPIISRDLGASRFDASRSAESISEEPATTGISLVAGRAGEDPRYVHVTGANSLVGPKSIDAAIEADWFSTCRFLHIGGFGILPSLESKDFSDALDRLKSSNKNIEISVDVTLMSNRTSKEWRSALQHVIGKCDVFMANEEEAKQILGAGGLAHPGRSPADPVKMGNEFLSMGPTAVVIKRGSAGSVIVRMGSDDAMSQRNDAKAGEVVVETTGAGDAWTAGFLRFRIEESNSIANSDLKKAGSIANAVAAKSVAHRGGLGWVYARRGESLPT